ncbi:methyltransferase domain-containing protein [Paraglaciecola aquimarina]|uniref:Methyltransferase domain-containing protein n=1 Tax=Paraglaciecola aquimarina TaxID=1235557 RepID=A0ABU3SZI2_9ALTE|nr:methyltransferase domain-containing protein [Paraglaciecola aquimarina]MDU0355403.1 methyltransferase domain-containing protein [Paraglaciecola aquimarina]
MKGLIENQLSEISRTFFGYHLVRLGYLSSEIRLPHCPIKHQVSMTGQLQAETSLLAKSTDLPIAENSVDTFVLAHELDFSNDPHQILREVDRAIMANGYLVLTGFNPFSLCGLFKHLPFNKGSVLHEARFFSCGRVKDWLQLLGFEIIDTKHLLFNELFLQRRIHQPSKWNAWATHYFASLCTMYIIVARKREIPLSIIKPKWQSNRKFSTVRANASARAGLNKVK